MQERLRTARIVTLTTLSATAAIISATGGWIMLVAAAGRWSRVADRRLAASSAGAGPSCGSSPRPSSYIQLVARLRRADERRPAQPGARLLAIPVLMVAARFSNRGLVVGAPISALLIIATTLGVDPGYVAAHPESLVGPAGARPLHRGLRQPARRLRRAPSRRQHARPAHGPAQPPRPRAALRRGRRAGRAQRPAGQRRARRHRPLQVRSTTTTATPSATPCCATSPRDAPQPAHLRAALPARRRGVPAAAPGRRQDDAARIAERLRVAIEELDPAGLRSPARSAWPRRATRASPSSPLLAAADAALYAAKRAAATGSSATTTRPLPWPDAL